MIQLLLATVLGKLPASGLVVLINPWRCVSFRS